VRIRRLEDRRDPGLANFIFRRETLELKAAIDRGQNFGRLDVGRAQGVAFLTNELDKLRSRNSTVACLSAMSRLNVVYVLKGKTGSPATP
jgi:hypothetical protein